MRGCRRGSARSAASEPLDVGTVPRSEQPAAQLPLDRLHHVEVLRGRHTAPRGHHAVGPSIL